MNGIRGWVWALVGALGLAPLSEAPPACADEIRELQLLATLRGEADWGHWGPLPRVYSAWRSHSNRLIPLYTFGCPLDSVQGANSVYRDPQKLTQLYGTLPRDTVNPTAEYFDQTDVYHLQKAAFAAGKKRIILFVFDGMDWQTTWAAAIYKSGRVGYREGRGSGLYFQDYRGTPTDYGFFCTSPHNDGTLFDVNAQRVKNPGGKLPGGYDPQLAGDKPWSRPRDPEYIIGQGASPARRKHAYTDSSSSATSMTAGIKTYNDAINVDPQGELVETIAHQMQRLGLSVGAVTTVPISHATPACTYAHNVSRDDYQDLTRDLLGLKSVSHRTAPLPGLDVLIGCGWGEDTRRLSVKQGGPDEMALAYTLSAWQHHEEQGDNFVPGNRYLTDADLQASDQSSGGRYQMAQRTPGQAGAAVLMAAAREAAAQKRRLFGYFGGKKGHLPFRTADGKFDPTYSSNPNSRRVGAADTLPEQYSPADLHENPTLADMARAALTVLSTNERGFWLMVEAGDVDWANHANNIDDSIGAVLSGDDAFRATVEWIESQPGGWRDTALFLTADHGHYLVLTRPEALAIKR